MTATQDAPLSCRDDGRGVTFDELNGARKTGRPVAVNNDKPFRVLSISGRHAAGVTLDGEPASYYLSWGPFWGETPTAHLSLCPGCPDCGEARP